MLKGTKGGGTKTTAIWIRLARFGEEGRFMCWDSETLPGGRGEDDAVVTLFIACMVVSPLSRSGGNSP